MATAAEQVPRLLALSTWLHGQDETTVDEVAREFAITPAQATADIRLLTMCEIPGQLGFYLLDVDLEALDSEGVVRPGIDNAPTRPARFSADEAVTLLVGLRTLAETATDDTAAIVESARAKIAAVAGEHTPIADRIQVTVSSATPEVRESIGRAIQQHRSLALAYVDGQGRRTTRTIDPLFTRIIDGQHYLEAWDLDRADRRSFRMDRIQRAEVLARAAADHAGQMGADWTRRLAEAEQTTLWVRAAAAWIVEYYPTGSVRPADASDAAAVGRELRDGDLVVTLGVLDPAWLSGLLLRCGADAVVLDPLGADAGARERAASTLEVYRRGTSGELFLQGRPVGSGA
ncbi:proteasome accessory factor C [Raineyella antarctica]|uniref:Proteasome accessory factor C n=1 Tax=Raineyella antarctica TaxID=1577474 RepID=A0A1G6GS02_9ACTN|nr:WYL domain-containing protein [Raineyella antarctica]SDB84679.1 proteasome accessory factor C [Raineyella antarctica]